MEPQDRINFTVKHESTDSYNMEDGEQSSIGDRVIDKEDRLGESTGGRTTTMKKRKERSTKNDTIDGKNPSSSADSQTIPNRPPLGHPPGFGKLQVLASLGGYAWDTFSRDFTPHIILVAPGENIVNRISNFSVPRSRTVCIISAVGLVSSIIIHDPNSVASTLKFEGTFEILQLSGWSHEGDDIRLMTISFSKLDGRNQVFGGAVASSLIAATPVQIIMGSFIQKVWETKDLI
ncbi:AT-hook motif nuclear-localized protein 9 isoform X2 [Cucumis sativus]|uniref:AT-hook motif nuclear-localized protein 9 isoform X2 n=1 Tax=Cucumis sativus TaxID=3659 RepID=UPI0012F4B576|nr:AT-hook motif nuclear-localized protein 9 isoform X2 [Cucumis sativus]KAE8646902.1 hypothetical protein Csa_020642 [Cucumis sativus]